MCDQCGELGKRGFDLPPRVPEHCEVITEGEILVFNTGLGLLAYVAGQFFLTVIDDESKPRFEGDVLYIHSRR